MTDIVERLLHMVPMDILGGRPMLLNPDGPAAVHEIDQLRNEIINFRAETKRLREELDNYKNGYKGACYACEPVGELNAKQADETEKLHEEIGFLRGCCSGMVKDVEALREKVAALEGK